jgi:hypothetical protein
MFADCQEFAGRSCDMAVNLAGIMMTSVETLTKFMDTMKKYATTEGIASLHEQIETFKTKAPDDIVIALLMPIDTILPDPNKPPPADMCGISPTAKLPPMNFSSTNNILLQVTRLLESSDDSGHARAENAFAFITDTVKGMTKDFGSSREYTEQAREGIQQLAETVHTTFDMMGDSVLGGLDTTGYTYKLIWWLYFFLVGTLTLAQLYYAFWASGFMGGPNTAAYDRPAEAAADGYVAPTTCCDRFKCCWQCCCSWCTWYQDSDLCFWSLILLLKVFVLILFIMSLVFIIVAGLWTGAGAGCAATSGPVNDVGECTELMMKIKNETLKTFWTNMHPGSDVATMCEDYKLATCAHATAKFEAARTYIALGGALVPVFSFYLIFMMAVMHERARWRRMFETVIEKL